MKHLTTKLQPILRVTFIICILVSIHVHGHTCLSNVGQPTDIGCWYIDWAFRHVPIAETFVG